MARADRAAARPGGASSSACSWRASPSSPSPSSTRPSAPRRRRPPSSSTARSASAPPRAKPRAPGWRRTKAAAPTATSSSSAAAPNSPAPAPGRWRAPPPAASKGAKATCRGRSNWPSPAPRAAAASSSSATAGRRPANRSGSPPRRAERDVSLDTVALTAEPADAAITRLQAPSALHAGDPLSLETTVRSTVAAPAKLTVRRNGVAVGHQQVKLGVGDNPFLFSVRAPLHPGSYGYEVEVEERSRLAPPERLAGDQRAGLGAAPRVLVAGPTDSTAAQLIKADGFKVTQRRTGRPAERRLGLRGHRRGGAGRRPRRSARQSPRHGARGSGQRAARSACWRSAANTPSRSASTTNRRSRKCCR